MSYTWATLSIPIPCSFMIITTVLKMKALIKENSSATQYVQDEKDK